MGTLRELISLSAHKFISIHYVVSPNPCAILTQLEKSNNRKFILLSELHQASSNL